MSGVAILGLGRRGSRWADALETAGWNVHAFDPLKTGGKWLQRRKETISATVHRAEWVLFCLPERLELIQSMIRRVQAETGDETGLLVVTDDFSVEDVQAGSTRPAQIALVTSGPDGLCLTVSDRTSPEMKLRAMAFLAEMPEFAAKSTEGGKKDTGARGAESA